MNPTAPTRDFISPTVRNLFWAITVGIWAALASALIVTGQSRWANTLSKAVFIRIDVEILLVLAVALALLDRRFRPSLTPLAWSVLGYCGALLLATAFSFDSYQSWWGTLERMDGTFTKLHYAVFFLILTGVFRTCSDWTNFLHASLAVSVLVAGKAVAERLSTGWRVGSTIGAPALTATYALLQIFFAALITTRGRTRPARLWGGTAMLLNVVTLLLTGERGAVIGLGAGALAVGLIVALSSRYSARLRRVALAGTLLLLVVPLAVYAVRGTPLVRWNTTLERLSQLSPHDRTTRTRLITLGVSWRAFKARPLLGYGPELYTLASVRHFNPDILTYEQGWWDRSHNTLTDRLVMEGAVGLLAYLSIFVAAGLMLVRAFRLKPHSVLTVPLTAGMLSAYFVQNLFLFDSPSSYLLFFAVLAFVSFLVTGGSHTEPREVAERAKTARIGAQRARAVRRRASPSPGGGRRGEISSSVRRFPRRDKVLIAGLALLVLVTIYSANLKGLAEASLGDELLASVDDPQRFQELFGQTVAYGSWAQDEVVATAADALRAVGAGNPAYLAASTEVAAQLEAQVGAHRHPDPRALIRLGSLYQAMAVADPTCLPKAEKAFRKAIELAPKWPESYDGLGATYLTEGKVDEGLALLKRAVEINPSNSTARWMYAFPLIRSHRVEGLAELEAALHNYNYHNRVDLKRLVNTYYQLRDLPRSIQFQLELTQLEPGDAVHHATLARLYKESGNMEAALQEIRAAAQLDPRYRAAAGDFERGR